MLFFAPHKGTNRRIHCTTWALILCVARSYNSLVHYLFPSVQKVGCLKPVTVGIFKKLFIYFQLCWVFVCCVGFSLVAASRGSSLVTKRGLLTGQILLWSSGSQAQAQVVVAHGLTYSRACGTFQDQGFNPCLLHWQAGSLPVSHQGSPTVGIFIPQKLAKFCRIRTVGSGSGNRQLNIYQQATGSGSH